MRGKHLTAKKKKDQRAPNGDLEDKNNAKNCLILHRPFSDF